MKSVCNRQRQIPQGIKGKYECLHFIYKMSTFFRDSVLYLLQ